MEKKDNKKIFLIVGICIAALIVIGGVIAGVLIFSKKDDTGGESDNPIIDNQTPQTVEPDQAINMYEDTTKNCDGVLVWDLQVGDTIPINDMNAVSGACKTDNYYSKMIGYTYDLDNNVIIHVNVLKKENNKLYKIDNTFVADYSEDTVDTSLNFGTTYEYVYQQDGDSYKLIRVQLMAVPDVQIDETVE